MNVLDRALLGATTAAARYLRSRGYPLTSETGIDSGGGVLPRGYGQSGKTDPKVAELCSTVFRCAAVRSDTLMALPGRLYKGVGGDRDEVTAGGAFELLRHINPHWDFPGLLAMTEWTLCTSQTGAFWILDAWDGAGKPHEIWWVAPGSIEVKKGKRSDDPEDWYVSHFEVDMGAGQPVRFDREHVVWFRSPSPLDEYRSLAPLLPAMASAVLSLNAMSANAMIFENGLTGAGIVSPKEGAAGLDDEGAIEVSKLLQRTLKGKRGFHRWLVMKFQNLEFQKLDLSPKDAQFVQALKLTREDVCNAMGVPLPIIQPTDTTFSNMRDAREALWSNLLLAERMRIQSAVFSQLVHRHFEGEADAFELDISQVPELRENEAERWKIERAKMDALVDLSLKVVTGEVGRDAAVKMAGRFIGLDEDVATACLPEAASDGRELNGAQVARAREIVLDVAAGQLPRETGVAMLGSFFNRPDEWAENVMGPVGDSFVVGVEEQEPEALPPPEDDEGEAEGGEAAEEVAGDTAVERGAMRRTVMVFEAGSQHVRDVTAGTRATEYGGELHRAHMRKAEEVEERHLPDVLDAVRTLFRGQGESIMSGLADLTDEDLARIVDEVGGRSGRRGGRDHGLGLRQPGVGQPQPRAAGRALRRRRGGRGR